MSCKASPNCDITMNVLSPTPVSADCCADLFNANDCSMQLLVWNSSVQSTITDLTANTAVAYG